LVVALRGSPLRVEHLRVTVIELALLAFFKPRSPARTALLMPRACLLAASSRLPRAVVSSAVHSPLRSLRSFAQYSSRFLISRSKPRSGGS
jgi:hypothetical protein